MNENGRLKRTLLALDGLSVGDCFGQQFFGTEDDVIRRITARILPAGPWTYTDDTEMALSMVEILMNHGEVHQDALAELFARRMTPHRHYGEGTFRLLCGVRDGRDWRALSGGGFRGMGSFGNGAAMRVAPLGAYFAFDEREVLVEQTRRSAEVTHAHPEGIAGAIAVAVATAEACYAPDLPMGAEWIERVLRHTPPGYTYEAIEEALTIPPGAGVVRAALALGNGSGITAPDTVPLCLWIAAHAEDFVSAMWDTVSALGDRDTTCAIVGGILAPRMGPMSIPVEWRRRRESLSLVT